MIQPPNPNRTFTLKTVELVVIHRGKEYTLGFLPFLLYIYTIHIYSLDFKRISSFPFLFFPAGRDLFYDLTVLTDMAKHQIGGQCLLYSYSSNSSVIWNSHTRSSTSETFYRIAEMLETGKITAVVVELTV